MINNYNEAYKDYYDKVRKKVKGKPNKVDKVINTKDYIYPSTANTGNYTYRRGNYQAKAGKKKFKYIDGFILRLILTFVLLLGVFTLKTLPNKESKEIYNIFKSAINSDFDYEKIIPNMEKIGFDYNDVKKNFEEKYNSVIKQISNINLDDINKALKSWQYKTLKVEGDFIEL